MKRSQYLDVLKGITALLVVLGNCIQYGSGADFMSSEAYFTDGLFKLIYTFHMAAFMTVSGYLFYYSVKKHSVGELLKRRLTSTLIPIVFFAQITVVVALATGSQAFSGIANFAKYEFKTITGTLWFLWALLFCSIAMLIIAKVPFAWLKVVLTVGLIGAFFIVPDSLNLNYFKFMFPSFLCGYMFAKTNCSEKIKTLATPIKVIGSVALYGIFAVMYIFFDKSKYVYTTGVTILGKNAPMQIYNDVYRWVIGIVGTACFAITVAIIYRLVKWQPARNLMAFVGKRSLGIYITNLLINSYLLTPLTKSFTPNVWVWLLETVVVLTLCTLLTWLIEHIKPLKFLMLGSR